MKSQQRDRERMRMMQWNGMRVLEWKWIGVSVIEVVKRKIVMGMDGQRTRMRIEMKRRDVW